MKDLLISLDSKFLKATFITKEGAASTCVEIPKDLYSGESPSEGFQELTGFIIDSCSSIVNKNQKPSGLHFLLSPEEVVLAFLTVNKNGLDPEEQLISAAEEKVKAPLEEHYYSFNKIAPFTYQFIAVKKEIIHLLMEISNLWGVPLQSIVPWPMLLPKTLKNLEPAIFVNRIENEDFVILSELNGVYHASIYENIVSASDLKKLVKKLSLYKRQKPIDQIYFLAGESDDYKGYKKLPILTGDAMEGYERGMETHSIFEKMLREDDTFLGSCVNLLSMLPLPEPFLQRVPAVPVAVTILLISILVGGYFLFSPDESSGVVSPSNDILSEQTPLEGMPEDFRGDQVSETTPGGNVGGESSVLLTKEDLLIRIENASGVNGAAGRTQALLEDLDYEVQSIGTANNMMEDTQIYIDEELYDLKEDLKEDLEDVVDEIIVDFFEGLTEEDLEEGFNHNVLIILGRNSRI